MLPQQAMPPSTNDDAQRLRDFVDVHRRLFVLTGAGCSTASGIPDYRDTAGLWKGAEPMQHQAFVASAASRQRYWARSMLGWRVLEQARPNAAHVALAQLQRRRPLAALVTQNVDGLHRVAGSRDVIDLHGRLDRVLCLHCGIRYTRRFVQTLLERANPGWLVDGRELRPDGDIELGPVDYDAYSVPACPRCDGVLKPDVVFFGGAVAKPTVERAWHGLARADAVLVVGSSLMVWSGFRFVREAARRGLSIAAVNRGVTRADDLLDVKLDADCAALLSHAFA